VSIAAPVFSNAMTPSATSTTNTGPLAIVTGDFNHDGKLDVITGNESGNGISVLFGNGDGTFQAPVNYSGVPGQSVWALATGDFNRDGILDLAVVSDNNAATGYVYIMFGNADGTFQTPAPELAVGAAPEGVAASDFNGDGNLDLAAAFFAVALRRGRLLGRSGASAKRLGGYTSCPQPTTFGTTF
jgi:hypothetical protein